MGTSINKQRTLAAIIHWLTIGIQIVISLFFVPFFLKTVGDKQYGLYSFSLSIISWIDTLIVTIGAAYYKFLSREKTEYGPDGESRAIGVFFTIFGIISVIILAAGLSFDLLIYFKIIKFNEYTNDETLQIVAIIIMSVISASFTSFLTVGKSYPYYKEKYIFSYSLTLFQVVLQTSLSILVLKMGFGTVYVALVHFASLGVISIFQFLFSHFRLKMRMSLVGVNEEDKQYRKKLLSEILKFTLFILIITVVDVVNKNVDKVLLGLYNADLVATYQLSLTIPSYLISFTSVITVLFTQQVNNEYSHQCSDEVIDSIFKKCSKIQTIITFLIVGGFLTVGKEFVLLWLDEDHLNVYYFSSILLVLYSFTCSNALNVIIRATKNLHKKPALIYLGVLIFNIIISFICLYFFPKEKAIWACLVGTIVSYIVGQVIIMQIYDYKITRLKTNHFFLNYVIYLIFTILIASVFYLMGYLIKYDNNLILSFFVKGLIFIFIYFIFIFIKDRKMFISFWKVLWKRGRINEKQ